MQDCGFHDFDQTVVEKHEKKCKHKRVPNQDLTSQADYDVVIAPRTNIHKKLQTAGFGKEWYRLVVDEAHEQQSTNCLDKLRAKRVWLLTGTPFSDVGIQTKFLQYARALQLWPFAYYTKGDKGSFFEKFSKMWKTQDAEGMDILTALLARITMRFTSGQTLVSEPEKGLLDSSRTQLKTKWVTLFAQTYSHSENLAVCR